MKIEEAAQIAYAGTPVDKHVGGRCTPAGKCAYGTLEGDEFGDVEIRIWYGSYHDEIDIHSVEAEIGGKWIDVSDRDIDNDLLDGFIKSHEMAV